MKSRTLFTALCFIALASGTASAVNEKQMRQRADSLMAQMTVKEKISQLMNSTPGIPRLGILPYNWWGEALHGVARNGRATVFPMPIGLGATFDPDLVQRVGDAVSDEARAKFRENQRLKNYATYTGLTYWAPNVNIFRDPRWGRGMETYGEDPYLTGQMGSAYVKGLQGSDPLYLKAAACGKHFAVHSGPEATRHSFNAEPSLKDLFETYLPAFRTLVQEGNVEIIMGAYNRVYGHSASGSKYLLTDLLRNQWGFKGHIVSDCGAVTDIYSGHHIVETEAEAAAIAIKAGLNVECGNSFRALEEALDKGLLTEEDIDNALRPLMMTRLKLGILGNDPDCPYNNIPSDVITSEKHRDLAREAARRSMVLLKNDGALPVSKDIPSIYVLGPGATDCYALMGNYYGVSNHYSTFLAGIASKVSYGTSINYKQGFQWDAHNANDMDWSKVEARNADVTFIFLGLTGNIEGEEGDAIASPHRGDRMDIKLPASQMDYLRSVCRNHTNKIVAVVTGGSPVDMQEVSQLCDAVIMAWYPGQEGGDALGELVFGESNFSGHLPLTFPLDVNRLPDFDDYSMQGRTYKYMDEGNVMYPFGYGLGYCTTRLSEARILNPKRKKGEALKLIAKVENAGEFTSNIPVQIYLSAPGAGISNPKNSLIAFRNESFGKNEVRYVEFEIPEEKLMTVQADGSSRLMKGEYTVTVSTAAPGQRSKELGVDCTSATFTVK